MPFRCRREDRRPAWIPPRYGPRGVRVGVGVVLVVACHSGIFAWGGNGENVSDNFKFKPYRCAARANAGYAKIAFTG
jgi:hypothetical protein